MKVLSFDEINMVSGAGNVNWEQAGREVAVGGATIAGTAFGTGLAGPLGPAIGLAAGVAVGALYDAAGNQKASGPAWNGICRPNKPLICMSKQGQYESYCNGL
ncbi:colicin V family bacteriocin [Serratia fonticola]|uniref:Colicin V family bacteriocin n=2 Tax=Serratia TaxID=613 RepID=A0AAJ2D960_SERFO|nr:colicin V family bacteriocin [Serratia fonticola]MDQ9125156.1 colicin V family bacteriocin [Serratia fonticola]OKP26688.1 hypothetical protein BSQ40_17700 [Serratia fonticola]CAI2149883.1 Uncharacterised protein [Serratia fonticola]